MQRLQPLDATATHLLREAERSPSA